MGERFLMWSDLPQKILSSPKELMLGLGPGVPERAPENESVRKIMYISSIQFQPFSFHNFYADVILQHGAIFFALMAAVIVSTVRRMWTLVRRGDVLAADLFYAISAWLIVWMTHSTGWSKPVAILSVLFALGHLLIANRLAPEGPLNKHVARQGTRQHCLI
jgi:O-antigen ligase